MKRKTLSHHEIRELNEKIKIYNFSFDKKELVEIVEDKVKIIKWKKETAFFYANEDIYPSLKMLLKELIKLKKITVDMGAVKFVANGADIMRPGIVHIEDNVNKDETVVIIDERNSKPLAIGKALLSSNEMREMKAGKMIENLHYVGDFIWQN